MFVDHIKIRAKAGDGGRGCVSFHLAWTLSEKGGAGVAGKCAVKTPWDRSKTDAGGGHYDHKR